MSAHARLREAVIARLVEYNPYHGKDGKFTTSQGVSGGGMTVAYAGKRPAGLTRAGIRAELKKRAERVNDSRPGEITRAGAERPNVTYAGKPTGGFAKGTRVDNYSATARSAARLEARLAAEKRQSDPGAVTRSPGAKYRQHSDSEVTLSRAAQARGKEGTIPMPGRRPTVKDAIAELKQRAYARRSARASAEFAKAEKTDADIQNEQAIAGKRPSGDLRAKIEQQAFLRRATGSSRAGGAKPLVQQANPEAGRMARDARFAARQKDPIVRRDTKDIEGRYTDPKATEDAFAAAQAGTFKVRDEQRKGLAKAAAALRSNARARKAAAKAAGGVYEGRKPSAATIKAELSRRAFRARTGGPSPRLEQAARAARPSKRKIATELLVRRGRSARIAQDDRSKAIGEYYRGGAKVSTEKGAIAAQKDNLFGVGERKRQLKRAAAERARIRSITRRT